MLESLEKTISDTCIFLYTELSSIEPLEDTTLSDIIKLTPVQALNFIKKSSNDLLEIKRNFLMMDEYRDYNSQ